MADPNALSGYVYPLAVLLSAGSISALVSMYVQIRIQKVTLKTIVNEVNPPDKPSLREMISDVRAKQGEAARENSQLHKEHLDLYHLVRDRRHGKLDR